MKNCIQVITNYILNLMCENEKVVLMCLAIASAYYLLINENLLEALVIFFLICSVGCLMYDIYIQYKNKQYSKKIEKEQFDEQIRNINDYISGNLNAEERAVIWKCIDNSNEGAYVAETYNGEFKENRNLYYCQNTPTYGYQIKIKDEFYELLKYMDENNKFIFSKEEKTLKNKNPFSEYYEDINIKN